MIKLRDYNYVELQRDIENFLRKYEYLQCETIGRSLQNRAIYALKIDRGGRRGKNIHVNASHHGIEWATSWILMNFVEDICEDSSQFKYINWSFVPMVNPDGVEMSSNLIREEGVRKKWSANARGVDINHNYPANWQQIEPSPCASRYCGAAPASEPETRAMMNYTRGKDFDMVVALHSQGEEIYWDFNQTSPSLRAAAFFMDIDKFIKTTRELAEVMAKASGYTVAQPEPLASFGGYKDWFIQEYRRPGFTIELGKGSNPLPLTALPGIYTKFKKMMEAVVKKLLDKNNF